MVIQERKVYIDVLRIMATLMVMFNHTGTLGFALYTVRTEGILYWIYLFLAILVKTAVPIFFMISGGLLLAKRETFFDVLYKRFWRFVCVLFVGSLVYYAYFSKWQFSIMSVQDFLKKVFEGSIVTPYWYLYSYLAFVLMLPFLRKFVCALTTSEFVCLILLYFVMKLLQVIQFILWQGAVVHSPYFSFFIMGDNIFFPLLGYFIEYHLPQTVYKAKYVILAVIGSILLIGFCSILTRFQSAVFNMWDEGSTQTFFNTFIFIPAGCIYFCIKYFFSRYSIRRIFSKVICTVGTCTFGVYLFETIYREETKQIFWKVLAYFPALFACLVWIFCAFVLGVIVTWVLKKLPVVKKLL